MDLWSCYFSLAWSQGESEFTCSVPTLGLFEREKDFQEREWRAPSKIPHTSWFIKLTRFISATLSPTSTSSLCFLRRRPVFFSFFLPLVDCGTKAKFLSNDVAYFCHDMCRRTSKTPNGHVNEARGHFCWRWSFKPNAATTWPLAKTSELLFAWYDIQGMLLE